MDQKPDPVELITAYLTACRPPLNATTADVAGVINAWNSLVEKLKQEANPE